MSQLRSGGLADARASCADHMSTQPGSKSLSPSERLGHSTPVAEASEFSDHLARPECVA